MVNLFSPLLCDLFTDEVLQATNELTANFIGDIYLNEVAARPHNSGHFTIEACVTSQFENHLRAVGHLPIGCTAMKMNHAIMINIIGSRVAVGRLILNA